MLKNLTKLFKVNHPSLSLRESYLTLRMIERVLRIEENKEEVFPDQVIGKFEKDLDFWRSQILENFISVGAYSETGGNQFIKQLLAEAIRKRDQLDCDISSLIIEDSYQSIL